MKNNLKRKIFLNNIEIMCSIGVHEFEKKKEQKIKIDLEILLSKENEPTKDSIDETLNYDEAKEIVLNIVKSKHFDLQETLAREIFDKISKMKFVSAVSVKTVKPDVYKDVEEVGYILSNF